MTDEVSKYQDLEIITEKIKQKGYYDKMLQILLQLFREESIFTFTELEKILSQTGDEADILEQFWINSEVFRSNLVLILTSMGRRGSVVNSIWKSEDLVRQVLEGSLGTGQAEARNTAVSQEYGTGDTAKLTEMDQKYRSSTKNMARAQPGGQKHKKTFEVVSPDEYSVKGGKFRPRHLKDQMLDSENEDTSKRRIANGRFISSEVGVNPPSSTQDREQANLFSAVGRQQSRGRAQAVHDTEQRRNSRSNERAGSQQRPRSAIKERSRDFGGSQYSSVYSRILNAGEVSKIKKLVGEQNSDLDVTAPHRRASF